MRQQISTTTAPNGASSLRLLLCVAAMSKEVHGRSWRDIQLRHSTTPNDIYYKAEDFEVDPFLLYANEEVQLSRNPVASPTGTPPYWPDGTPVLSRDFDGGNTNDPPSLSDSERFPENPAPLNPPRGYFEYSDQDSSLYGPGHPSLIRGEDGFTVQYQNNAWKFVQNPTNDFYWDEFTTTKGFGAWKGALATRDFSRNQCGNVGQQSPIDIRLTGVACVEHHQIRTRPGDFRVSGSSVEKKIEANKLRLQWQRRPCADLMDPLCEEPDPPHADFPNGWGGFADMMHVDFKIPAEHRIYGEVFDAEMQIFHVHPGRQRLPAISVLIRVDPNGFNSYLQAAIDAFQYESDLHRAQCAERIRSNRRLVSDFHGSIMGDFLSDPLLMDYESWADYSTLLDDPAFVEQGKEHERVLTSGIWYPTSPELMPTYWFYGYDGSLTEPPCTEIVSWFVMDAPMIIAPEQLDQMKTILFTHVDPDCKRTSVHFNGGVARPIQETGGRQVWRCTRDDFVPDHERTN